MPASRIVSPTLSLRRKRGDERCLEPKNHSLLANGFRESGHFFVEREQKMRYTRTTVGNAADRTGS